MKKELFQQFNSVLKFSFVIINMFITNMIFVVLSVVSLFIMTPVLTAAAMDMSQQIIDKDFDDLLKRYLKFIRGKVIKSFLLAAPFMIIIVISFINLLFAEVIFEGVLNTTVIGILLVFQIFIAFEAFNMLMLSLSQIRINPKKSNKKIIRDAFLIGNKHFVRMLIGCLTIIVSIALGVNISILFFLVGSTFAIFLYYASFSVILKTHFHSNGEFIKM